MRVGMTVGLTVSLGNHYAKVSVYAEDEDENIVLTEPSLSGKADILYGLLSEIVLDKLADMADLLEEEGYATKEKGRRGRRSSR